MSFQRNLTPDQMSFIRGRRYNRSKKAHGAPAGNDNAAKQTCQNVTIVSTAKALADQYGVTKRTIRRDGADAELLDRHPGGFYNM